MAVFIMFSDGKTKETTGRHEECISVRQREGLGIIQKQGSVYGAESLRTSNIDCSGENSIGTTQHGNPTAGKILERLELIENEYLSYVHGHQERLETRLEESKTREAGFRQLVQEIKQEIYHLTSQQPKSEDEE